MTHKTKPWNVHIVIINYTYFITTPLYLFIVYINDVWTVGDVWNSQNIPKSKQRISRFLSNLFGKLDRSSQVEISILSQQLTESLQARKETEKTLQDVIESHQQEILHSNTRHQETQFWLQSQLQGTQVQLQHSQQNFQNCQWEIQVFVSDV